MTEAAAWYESRIEGLGVRFREEVLDVLGALAQNPHLSSRQHPRKNIRWRYPQSFPYRVIYEVQDDSHTVIVAAVVHAARHDRHWRRRI